MKPGKDAKEDMNEVKIKEAIEKLSKDYELTKREEELSRQEVEKHEKVYLDEKGLLEKKK